MINIKNKNLIGWFAILILSPVVLLLSSCEGVLSNNKIIVANFESYISPELESNLKNNNNVDYKSFSSNEQAEREFRTNHNISVPSSYVAIKLIQEGSVEAIDWASITNGRITSADDALPYFTNDVQSLLVSYDLDGDGINDNLLNWSIPYFAQDLVIGYKSETSFLDGKTINEAITEIGKMTGSSKKFNRISMIDETRTMYGLVNRINGLDYVNPSKSTTSIRDFNNNFSPLINHLGNDKVLFNTDSGIALNDFAADNGSDVLIAYNGDMLYATYGGDSGMVPTKPLQIYRPIGTSIAQALELVIVNKGLYSKLDSSSKVNIWDIMRKLSFDLPTEMIAPTQIVNWESSWSYINFDFVNYTPTIKGLYNFLITDNWYEFTPLQREIYELGSLTKNLIDGSITNEQQFNMQYAYMETKSKM